MDTIVLFLIQIVSVYYTVKNLEISNVSPPDLRKLLQLLWITVITFPLFEESLFRHTLKYYLADIPYSRYITSILFGVAHMENYLIHENMYHILFQILCTTYLGYYLFQFDNFLYAYLIHAYYNAFIILSSYAVIYWKYSNKNNKSDNTECQFNIENLISYKPIYVNIKCPTITSDDMIKCDKFKSIIYTKINKEMRERVMKLQNIMDKRKYNCMQFVDIVNVKY